MDGSDPDGEFELQKWHSSPKPRRQIQQTMHWKSAMILMGILSQQVQSNHGNKQAMKA